MVKGSKRRERKRGEMKTRRFSPQKKKKKNAQMQSPIPQENKETTRGKKNTNRDEGRKIRMLEQGLARKKNKSPRNPLKGGKRQRKVRGGEVYES